MRHFELPDDTFLGGVLRQTHQPQPPPAQLSLQEHKQQLQTTAQQVEDICKRISAPCLFSALSEIDAEMMLNRLGAIETCARLARKAVRSVNVQHPSSPPAQRRCQQVHCHPLAVACSWWTRWPHHVQPQNEAEVDVANSVQQPHVLTVLGISAVSFSIPAVFTNLWQDGHAIDLRPATEVILRCSHFRSQIGD